VKTAGETLSSIATGPQSLIQGDGAADKLKSYNLDILYNDDTLYPGQQLWLPIHICFEDEKSDCHIVKAKETLESIAKIYNTTGDDLYSYANNFDIIGDYGSAPVVVGMELSVPTLRPAQPPPCRGIPGYWSCYTVKANDTILASDLDHVGISTRVGASAAELILLNFGKSPNHCCIGYDCYPGVKGGCSNATACPASKGPYPECLQIGQVLTVPVAPACVPRPGAWNCTPSLVAASDLSSFNPPALYDPFCKANRRAFPGCRDGAPDAQVRQGLYTVNQTVKDPIPICIPNDKSYCSGTNSTVSGDMYHQFQGEAAVSGWDGNQLVLCYEQDYPPRGEYHIPRGSLREAYYFARCTPAPGQHLCHTPLPPIPSGTDSIWQCGPPGSGPGACLWEDSVYQIAQQFGVDWKDLCALNQMKNCSVLPFTSALKIPVRSTGPAPLPLPAMHSAGPTTTSSGAQ
jgi:LysM repeat protein